MGDTEVRNLIITGTFIFLLAPAFVVIFMMIYNQRRKMHAKEKDLMLQKFDTEIARAQLEVQEQTLKTIGADLHDNIGQLLSLTALTLKSIEVEDASKLNQKLDTAIELVSHSIHELRSLGKLLEGEQLIALGLDKAIQHEVGWMEKAGKFKISYWRNCDLPQSNSDKDLILFRILQEVLNNIIKHSRAKKIDIKLDCREERMFLVVSDNGVGFDSNLPQKPQWGMGLQNIRNRAALIRGEAEIESIPTKGTKISISIPYP